MTKKENLLEELDLAEPMDRLRLVGAMNKPFHVAYERDLTEGDMAAMTLPRPAPPRTIVRIHASHHSLARCLAAGMKLQQAALITGYSIVRIQQLQKDETFLSLVADYRAEIKSIFADLADRMNDLSLDAIELLQERLHTNPEGFSVPMLLDVVKAFADRTGHGPGQEVHLKMSADLIDRPPRESHEEWQARRTRELITDEVTEVKKLN